MTNTVRPALAGLAFAVSSGGLGVPEAARAVPILGQGGPGSEPTPTPTPAREPSNPDQPLITPRFTFAPIGGGSPLPSSLPSSLSSSSPSASPSRR